MWRGGEVDPLRHRQTKGPATDMVALADLLLVDGNPLENIKLIEDPDKKFLVIMKDGIIYKNALPK
jgi:hypothetical protein